MSPLEIVALCALIVYAIYKQTHVGEVQEKSRFKLAIIYAIVGLCVGGITVPVGALGYVLAGLGIVLSVIVGLARGYKTKVWVAGDGRVLRQGTVLTVSLFLALILSKFVIGSFAYVDHVNDGAGFGEVMIMMAIMVAVQAQIVWNRAKALSGSTSVSSSPATSAVTPV